MTHESGTPTGELVQEYVRIRWRRAGTAARAKEIGQHLGPALRSRIDVLGTDGQQLLAVPSHLVLRKLEELEQQAVLEDRGMLEKASESRRAEERTWHSGTQKPTYGPRKRAVQIGSRRQTRSVRSQS